MKETRLKQRRCQALATYIHLMRATNQVTGRIHRHLQADSLTHSQFAVLEALFHLGSLSQGELGQKILKSNANLTTVVDSLEKKNLVQRDRSADDRRRVLVRLTEAGHELIAQVFPRHAEVIEREMTVLSLEEQKLLSDLLKKLANRD